MNALSWTLYLADVSDSVKGFSGFLTWFLCGLFILGFVISGGIFAATDDIRDPAEKEQARRVSRWFSKTSLTIFMPIWLIAFLITAFIPARNTLMLIAASQFGEVVLTSEEATKIGGEAGDLATDSIRLLHQYVQDQLNPPKPEPKSEK